LPRAVNTIGQSKRGGGDRSSRPAQLQARENEQKALSLWIKGATFQQIAAAGFGIASASGAWRSVGRALARIPKQEADQAREAQRARLQAVRMLLWNHAGTDPVRAAEALIKLEAREARLLGLDMPTKVAVTDPVARFPQTFFVPSRQRKTEGRGSDVIGRLKGGAQDTEAVHGAETEFLFS